MKSDHMMYLYAITDQPKRVVPPVLGLEDVLCLSIPYQDIAAVVSPLTAAKVVLTESNLWRHEAVVEALMADRTVLPARFGTVLSSEAAVQAALMANYADFVANLKRVCGRVELGLRVLWDGGESRLVAPDRSKCMGRQASEMGGRSYLLTRLEEKRQTQIWRQRAEVLAAELHLSLAHLAAESTYQVLVTPRMLLVAAYLVERDYVTTFQQIVNTLKTVYPTLDLLCTGPWPPYSFVSAGTLTANEKERDVRV